MAVAALVAWALVSLLDVGQRSGNDNFHTAVPPNPASGTAHPAATATHDEAGVGLLDGPGRRELA
jgi:hypothetical protein